MPSLAQKWMDQGMNEKKIFTICKLNLQTVKL